MEEGTYEFIEAPVIKLTSAELAFSTFSLITTFSDGKAPAGPQDSFEGYRRQLKTCLSMRDKYDILQKKK